MNNEIFSFKSSKVNNSFQINNNNQERSNSKSMTIMNNSKMDFLYFKNDILKDLKKFEKDLTDKYNKGDLILKEEIININNNINSIKTKISELSTLISVDNMTKEKVENLDKIKRKIIDDILVNEIKIDNIDKETKESIIKINNILRETVIYNGLIGPSCKYKSFHDLIDHILNDLLLLDNYKDKNAMDLSTYKKKLDSIMQGLRFQIDGIVKTSTQFTIDNFNILDKKLKDFIININDKFEKIKDNLEENLNNINNKIDELGSKLNEIETGNKNLVNSFNEHIEKYLVLKKEIRKINDIINKNNFPFKKRNSIFNRLDSKDNFDENVKTNINKNKIKKRNSLIKKELNNDEEFQLKNSIFKDNDIIINEQETNVSKNNSKKFINDNEIINNQNISDVKINSNINLKINEGYSNLSKKRLNIEINPLKNLENQTQKSSNGCTIFSENNLINNINDKVVLSDSEKERVKIQMKSQDVNLNKNKTISKFYFKNEKKLDVTSSQNSSNSQISQKYIKNGNYEEEQKLNIKIKNNKNIFNQKLKKLNEQNNNIYISDFNKYKTLIIGNNTRNDKIFNIKTIKNPSIFKNIILTLEGSRKMVIDSKDKDNGKNIYHIEYANKNKKYPKLNINKERLSTSSKPNIINKNNNLFQNDNLYIPNDEFANTVKFKNARIIYLIKSKSHKFLMKKSPTNEFDPSFSITKYSPVNSNKILNIDETNKRNIK